MAFLGINQATNAPVALLYIVETTTDSGLGFCIISYYGALFILSLVVPMIMTLNPSYAFFLFSICSIVGAVYTVCIVKETKGLSDSEKKSLYTPVGYHKEMYDDFDDNNDMKWMIN